MINSEQITQPPPSGRRGWVVATWVAAAALVAGTAVTAAVRAFTVTQTPRPAMSTFVRRSQLGMGERSLNQLANAEIRRDLHRAGMVVKRTVIYSTRIDGDTGTVVAHVSYGLPAGPVQKIDQALTNPHTLHRGDVIEKDWYKGIASPIRLERSKPSLRRTPPKFSQHSAEVLAEFGYSTDEIDALMENGVVCGSERKR